MVDRRIVVRLMVRMVFFNASIEWVIDLDEGSLVFSRMHGRGVWDRFRVRVAYSSLWRLGQPSRRPWWRLYTCSREPQGALRPQERHCCVSAGGTEVGLRRARGSMQ